MAQQEGGWPLGLQPLNVRIGLIRNVDFPGSLSFSTLLTSSSSSSSSDSTDLDTESTGSFFHDRSITLGSLIGISSILDLSNRSLRRNRRQESLRLKKSHKTKTLFSLCIRSPLSGEMICGNSNNRSTPSLGYFLEAERRTSNVRSSNGVSIAYELDGLPESQPATEPNSLFSEGLVLPPQSDHHNRTLILVGDVHKSKKQFSSNNQGASHEVLGIDNGHCLALIFPCIHMGGRSSQ